MRISRTVIVPPYGFELTLQTKNGEAHSTFSQDAHRQVLEKILADTSMQLHRQIAAIGGDHGTTGGDAAKV